MSKIKKRIFLGLFIFILTAFCGLFLIPMEVVGTFPRNGSQGIEIDSEIKINFSMPVNRDILIPSITPEVPGEWRYENPLFSDFKLFRQFGNYNFLDKHLYRTLVFVPDQVLMPETSYKIQLNNIKGVFNIGEANDLSFTFLTQSLPKVAETEPKDGAFDIPPFSEIKIRLTEPNPELVDFDFILEPEVEFEERLNEEKDQYALIPQSGFLQGIKYNLKVIGTFLVKDKETGEVIFQGEPQDLYQGSFETLPPPKIASFRPTGKNVLTDEKIEIFFSEAMQKPSVEDNFLVDPSVKGDFLWSEDGAALTFKPLTKISYDTIFNITVKKGALTEKKGYLPEDVVFSFETIGRVLASFSPGNGASGISVKSPIKVYFNQSVNEESAKEHFKIEPDISGNFYFKGNTMTFQPSSLLSHQTTYKITLLPGVKSVYGLDSNQSFSAAFTTELKTVKLAVPLDFQDYPLSCEAASLKMALAYKGVHASEDQILSYTGVDPVPRQDNIWGDPYIIYVGDIMGKQNSTGYGVYWEPIAKAARVWRSNSEAFTNWNISHLTKEIENGNPVVVWGTIGSNAYQDSWYTKDGKYIYAWKGEHARVVVGFIGKPESPSRIILNDPYVGQLYWSTSSFLSNWNIFGNSGVVVK